MKIIGSGLLANGFLARYTALPADVIVFASGVSNSQESSDENFQRERKMLSLLPFDVKLVYFSTCSIESSEKKNTPYVLHKCSIENELLLRRIKPLILRLPQVVGSGGNSRNLLNFVSYSIQNNLEFDIQGSAFRNLIDVQDVVDITLMLINLNANGVMNVANPLNVSVLDIVRHLEMVLNKKANYNIVDGGIDLTIDISKVIRLIPGYENFFESDYNYRLISKYFKAAN